MAEAVDAEVVVAAVEVAAASSMAQIGSVFSGGISLWLVIA